MLARISTIFEQEFGLATNTKLLGGADEPVYLPADGEHGIAIGCSIERTTCPAHSMKLPTGVLRVRRGESLKTLVTGITQMGAR